NVSLGISISCTGRERTMSSVASVEPESTTITSAPRPSSSCPSTTSRTSPIASASSLARMITETAGWAAAVPASTGGQSSRILPRSVERPDVAAELRRLARMLRDNWWIIVACVAAAVAAAALYEASKTTAYEAQAKVLLLQDDPNATLGAQGFFLDPVRQRATALELITGPNVTTRVQRQLKLKKPPTGARASASGDSNVVTITVTGQRRLRSARVADSY